MLPVLQKNADREHPRSFGRRFRAAVAIAGLFAIACSRPASYEQFVKADDATAGIYEFTLDMSDTTASYDISLYTAPLHNPLLLDITWLVPPKSLSNSEIAMSPFLQMPEGDTAQLAGNQHVDGHSKTDIAEFREAVWFPAGEHRALYRSGISFGRNKQMHERPAGAITGEHFFCEPANDSGGNNNELAGSSYGLKVGPGNPSFCQEVKLQVKINNQPDGFRGLGIICKRNNGTR